MGILSLIGCARPAGLDRIGCLCLLDMAVMIGHCMLRQIRETRSTRHVSMTRDSQTVCTVLLRWGVGVFSRIAENNWTLASTQVNYQNLPQESCSFREAQTSLLSVSSVFLCCVNDIQHYLQLAYIKKNSRILQTGSWIMCSLCLKKTRGYWGLGCLTETFV